MSGSISRKIASIPHWARVAFAARCVRIVSPLFEQYWPDAEPQRLEAIQTATRLAEQSAQEARAVEGLDAAVVEAIMTAGAAIIPTTRISYTGTAPPDDHACHTTSFVAKSAEWAAKAAKAGPDDSANAALQAYAFAHEAAHMSEAVEVLSQLQTDFVALHRVAARGRWTDDTPVPAKIFDLLDDEPPADPWWKFWR